MIVHQVLIRIKQVNLPASLAPLKLSVQVEPLRPLLLVDLVSIHCQALLIV